MVKLRLLSYSALVAAAIAAAMSAHPACARDVTTPEPGEAFPGGAATSREAARDDSAFSNPSGNIPDSRMSDFREGSDNFRKLREIKAKYDPDNRFRFNQNIRPAA